jgi:hypothetical protein
VIILDYGASVYLVASVDTEQQTQSRSTCHVQKTTNATEINRRTTRNYALGDLSTQILKISRLLEATDSSQCLLMSVHPTYCPVYVSTLLQPYEQYGAVCIPHAALFPRHTSSSLRLTDVIVSFRTSVELLIMYSRIYYLS